MKRRTASNSSAEGFFCLVVLGGCLLAPITSYAGGGRIDDHGDHGSADLSVYITDVSGSEAQEKIEACNSQASEILWDATDGQFYLGDVTFVSGKVAGGNSYTATELQDGTELVNGQLTGGELEIGPGETEEPTKTVVFERAPTVRIDAEVQLTCDASDEPESAQGNNEATEQFRW